MRDPFLPLSDALPLTRPWSGRRLGGGVDRQRGTYQSVLPLALVGSLLTLTLSWPAPPAALGLGLGVSGLLAAALVLSATPRCPLWVLDALLLAGGWAFLLGQLALTLFRPDAAADVTALGGLLPWFLVLLLAPGWLLGQTQGRVVSLGALGLTLGLTVAALTGPLSSWGPAGGAVLGWLAQLLLASAAAMLGQETAAWRSRDLARQGAWAGLAEEERDALTGLPHRRALTRLLTAHLRRQGPGLAVMALRIDGLERIEEERGVAFAEALRAHLARTLSAAVRHGDVVGCLERGSFAVLMRVPDARTARISGERLRLRVASRPLGGVLTTVSVGVALWRGHSAGRALLADAEEALERAHTAGGNCVALALAAPPTSPATAAA
ncbi:sensor domain-containing diguanylate cyclase [Deinococcus budaensis]|uniref:Diguanylate cyclase (GGDEF)-like protein n=1 Tax=Deinococcus budaensis TaxID=1665626 RepID=A0A7W8GDJ0_9DEIO|nr:GGDEF domain-containing protein [Deinococcus budaensis]MBB5233604.1 diguanylate cyclase (GGDEF)-like protein [Deinococcus budaensis]